MLGTAWSGWRILIRTLVVCLILIAAVVGEHMARTLVDLHRRGERVFAVVGSGNVIRIEWILRKAGGAPPAADQPG